MKKYNITRLYSFCLLFVCMITITACSGQKDNNKQTVQDSDTTVAESVTSNNAESVASTAAETDTESNEISEDEAKEIILQDAGLSSSEVTFIKCKRHFEDNIVVYDIEFVTDDKKYDYEIQTENGRILESDVDLIEQVFGTPTVSIEEAKAAALAYTGVSETNAVFVKIELEHDDNDYDIEFYSDSILYECEVDSYSGNVTKMEKEYQQ